MSDQLSVAFLTPPAVFILLSLLGALLSLAWRRVGIAVSLASSLCLYVLSTSAASSYLLHAVEARLPSTPDFEGAQAIVVLGGDARLGESPESATLGVLSLERVAFAAQAYRQLQLPVLVSGGTISDSPATFAGLMKTALEEDFRVPVKWTEDQSATTWENAADSARLLAADNVTRVVVVTQAWHLPRALWCFKRVGVHAVPWAVPRVSPHDSRADDFLPSAGAIWDSFHAFHEIIGAVYYRLRY